MAWEMLYGGLFHQGSIYPATAAVLPFLIDLLAELDVDQQGQLLLFLAQIGGQSLNLHYLEKYLAEGKAWAGRELAAAREALVVLPEGLMVYARFLDHQQPAIQSAALAVLAWCGEGAVAPIADCISQGNLPPEVLETAYLALGHAAESALPIFSAGLEHISQRVQLAACLGWILAAKGAVPEGLIRHLADVLDQSNVYRLVARRLAALQDALGTPDAYLRPLSSDQLKILVGASVRDPLAWSLTTLVDAHESAMNLAEFYLKRVFTDPPYGDDLTPGMLSGNQMSLLTALAQSEAAWHYEANMANMLHDIGIRFCSDRQSLIAFLQKPELTQVMILDPTWSPDAEAQCVALGRDSWREAPFMFFQGDTSILDTLIPEDPADFPPDLMADAKKVASSLYRTVVKKTSPGLSSFRFYEGLSREALKTLCADQGWVVAPAPEPTTASGMGMASEPDQGHKAAMGWDDLTPGQKMEVTLFVEALSAAGWLETAAWNHQLRTGGASLTPIAFGRFHHQAAHLEISLWFYDEIVASLYGRRAGDPYVKLAIKDRGDAEVVCYRLYYGGDLEALLEMVTWRQDNLSSRSVRTLLVDPCLPMLPRVALDLGNMSLVEITLPRDRLP
jgi:hypothetical protein